jgi:hypothetical protein
VFRSIRLTAVLTATAALAAAPAAFARPADQGVQAAPVVQQLHDPPLVHYGLGPSAQLPAPAVVTYSPPVASTPVQAEPGGGSSPIPWIAGGAALLLFAAYGVFRFSGVRPSRRHQPAA